jgi:hypothetical protein
VLVITTDRRLLVDTDKQRVLDGMAVVLPERDSG